MNNTGVTGLTAKKKDFEHARGPRNSAYAVNLTYDRHTPIQCSPHNSNPLNKKFRLLRKNPGSHHRNNTKNSNGKIRLNRRSKIQIMS